MCQNQGTYALDTKWCMFPTHQWAAIAVHMTTQGAQLIMSSTSHQRANDHARMCQSGSCTKGCQNNLRVKRSFSLIIVETVFCCLTMPGGLSIFVLFASVSAADTCWIWMGHVQGDLSIPDETGCHFQIIQKDSWSPY